MKRLTIIGKIYLLLVFIIAVSCNSQPAETANQTKSQKINYSFQALDSSFRNIVSSDATVNIIAEGFQWSEGCLWIEKEKMLLFSDVPKNIVYKWTELNGLETYLSPSGYTSSSPSDCKEPGSNGLTLNNNGQLVLCQHGDRRVAVMNSSLQTPKPIFTTIADKYNNKQFSSPNDLVFNNNGELFFTDPPYGLKTQDDNDLKKEIPFNGIYKVYKAGKVVLLCDSITRPNGIALFPKQNKLLVANSDPNKPNWYVWDIDGDKLINGKIFASLAGYDKKLKGLPDGLKIDSKGIVYATAPGGIYFFNSEGKTLGILHLDNPSSNCCLSTDEKTLFITNNNYSLKVQLRK